MFIRLACFVKKKLATNFEAKKSFKIECLFENDDATVAYAHFLYNLACLGGATTLSIMALSMIAFSMMVLSIMALSIMALSIMALSIMALSIMTQNRAYM